MAAHLAGHMYADFQPPLHVLGHRDDVGGREPAMAVALGGPPPDARPFACSVEGCTRRYKNARSVDAHIKDFHTPARQNRPYTCHVADCGKRFGTALGLQRHAAVHSSETPYVCSYDGCGRAFKVQKSLRNHLSLAHTGAKPFVCGACGKGYVERAKLNRHLKNHKTYAQLEQELREMRDRHAENESELKRSVARLDKERRALAAKLSAMANRTGAETANYAAAGVRPRAGGKRLPGDDPAGHVTQRLPGGDPCALFEFDFPGVLANALGEGFVRYVQRHRRMTEDARAALMDGYLAAQATKEAALGVADSPQQRFDLQQSLLLGMQAFHLEQVRHLHIEQQELLRRYQNERLHRSTRPSLRGFGLADGHGDGAGASEHRPREDDEGDASRASKRQRTVGEEGDGGDGGEGDDMDGVDGVGVGVGDHEEGDGEGEDGDEGGEGEGDGGEEHEDAGSDDGM